MKATARTDSDSASQSQRRQPDSSEAIPTISRDGISHIQQGRPDTAVATVPNSHAGVLSSDASVLGVSNPGSGVGVLVGTGV